MDANGVSESKLGTWANQRKITVPVTERALLSAVSAVSSLHHDHNEPREAGSKEHDPPKTERTDTTLCPSQSRGDDRQIARDDHEPEVRACGGRGASAFGLTTLARRRFVLRLARSI